MKIKYQAEDPDAQPAKDMLKRLSAPGLPAYAILKPEARVTVWPHSPARRVAGPVHTPDVTTDS